MVGLHSLRKLFALIIMISLALVGCADLGEEIPVGPNGTIAQLSIEDAINIEGQTLVFIISLDRVAVDTVTFDWATSDGTAVGEVDYNSASGQETIAIGLQSTLINVPTLNDTLVESGELFTITVSNIIGAESIRAVATGTITDDDNPAMISYSADILPIWQAKSCLLAGCHGGGSTSGGLGLADGAYASVRNASGNNGPIIISESAGSSNLYLKTTSTPPFLSRMPLVGNPLSQIQQELIRDWINQGALDN